MDIVVGSGKNRRSFTIPHRSTVSRGEFDKMREDVKAFVTRPATFRGYSR